MRLPTLFLVTICLLAALHGCSGNDQPEEEAVSPPEAAQAATESAGDNSSPAVSRNPATRRGPAGPTTVTPRNAPTDMRAPGDHATVYQVQPGDTLWDIAIAHRVTLDTLLIANNLKDPDTIWAGQRLIIPRPGGVRVEAPPTLRPPAGPDGLSGTAATARSQPAPADSLVPLQSQVLLEPMLHDWQKMNNCAPTTLAMALSYYGLLLTQFDTAPVLKGGPQDKNVSPAEIVTYLHDLDFGGIARVNGDIETLQRLVSNDIPIIVEQWLDRPGDELTGHYRLVRGYDQAAQEIIVNDSYNGPRLRFAYAEFDRLWRPFNRVYIPVYRPQQEPVVRGIVRDNWDDRTMYARAVEMARAEIDTLGDAYAWFNLGQSLLGLGEYQPAADAFDRAIQIGLPARMLWYQFGAFEAYNQTGQFQRVLDLSAPLMGIGLEELHYQRGIAHEGLGQREAALAEYQRAARLNPRLAKAVEAAARLQDTGGS